jgi:hypothetical protein
MDRASATAAPAGQIQTQTRRTRARSERGAVVGDVHDGEEIRDDDADVFRVHKTQDQPFRDLVQRVEGEREQQDVFHGSVTSLKRYIVNRELVGEVVIR